MTNGDKSVPLRIDVISNALAQRRNVHPLAELKQPTSDIFNFG